LQIITFLKEFGLSESEINLLAPLGKEVIVPANQLLFGADKVFNEFWFVQQGILRAYRIIDGNDFTYAFFLPGDIAVDYESYLKGVESNHFVESLSETVYLKFDKKKVEALYEEHPRIERIARAMAEKAYLRAVGRLKEFQTDSLESRYLHLISQHVELFKTAPLQHIASFLGAKPQSLSRVRAKLANKIY
jgi:CRP-like cAMP-binding protein